MFIGKLKAMSMNLSLNKHTGKDYAIIKDRIFTGFAFKFNEHYVDFAHISWKQKMRNEVFYKYLKTDNTLLYTVKVRKLKFVGRTKIRQNILEVEGKVEGRRP